MKGKTLWIYYCTACLNYIRFSRKEPHRDKWFGDGIWVAKAQTGSFCVKAFESLTGIELTDDPNMLVECRVVSTREGFEVCPVETWTWEGP